MHRVLDAPFLELLWDFRPIRGAILPSFTVRYYRGLTGDRPAWILPYLCEQGQFGMQAPGAECDLCNMTVITNWSPGLHARGAERRGDAQRIQPADRGIARRTRPGAKSLEAGGACSLAREPPLASMESAPSAMKRRSATGLQAALIP